MRNLKASGLALVTVLALGAIAASAASANQFHSGSTNTTWTVSSNSTQAFQYETNGPTVECSTIGGSGETTAQTVTEVTFHPTYSGCNVNQIFGSSAEVNVNSCIFKLTIDVSVNSGSLHLKLCIKKFQITIKVFGVDICTLSFGEQTPAGVVHYANNGASQVEAEPALTEISGTREGSVECGKATSTTGSYKGKVQVKGEITNQTTATNVQVG